LGSDLGSDLGSACRVRFSMGPFKAYPIWCLIWVPIRVLKTMLKVILKKV
jgi:hypothetical protein